MSDKKRLNRLQQEILAIQTGKPVYVGDEIIGEDGKEVLSNEKLNWTGLSAQALGKCGELYAQYILEWCGYQTYLPSVDDHSVDLLAKDSAGKAYKIQVKTVSAGSYTFIRRDFFKEDLIVFHFRISDNVAKLYIYHKRDFPEEGSGKIEPKDQFSYHSYSKAENKSKPEYGISGANKHYKDDSPYLVGGNEWDFEIDDVIRLMRDKA